METKKIYVVAWEAYPEEEGVDWFLDKAVALKLLESRKKEALERMQDTYEVIMFELDVLEPSNTYLDQIEDVLMNNCEEYFPLNTARLKNQEIEAATYDAEDKLRNMWVNELKREEKDIWIQDENEDYRMCEEAQDIFNNFYTG